MDVIYYKRSIVLLVRGSKEVLTAAEAAVITRKSLNERSTISVCPSVFSKGGITEKWKAKRIYRGTARHCGCFGFWGLDVLATPRLVAMVENTCWEALEPTLDKGFTTVGTKFSINHLKPSPVGATITVLVQWEKNRGSISLSGNRRETTDHCQWDASTSSSGNLSVHEKVNETKLICVPMATMC